MEQDTVTTRTNISHTEETQLIPAHLILFLEPHVFIIYIILRGMSGPTKDLETAT